MLTLHLQLKRLFFLNSILKKKETLFSLRKALLKLLSLRSRQIKIRRRTAYFTRRAKKYNVIERYYWLTVFSKKKASFFDFRFYKLPILLHRNVVSNGLFLIMYKNTFIFIKQIILNLFAVFFSFVKSFGLTTKIKILTKKYR